MINITAIERTMTQGATKPWLCLGDNGLQYIVKRLNATFGGCIKEWIAGRLGILFGLNIPAVQQVYIGEYLVQFDSEHESELGVGIAFASEFRSNLNEINYSQLLNANRDVQLDILVFDYWLQNEDRTLTQNGGNPNLYIDIQNNELVVFDHNLAFDSDFDLNGFKQTHSCINIFRQEGISSLRELIDPDTYRERLDCAYNHLDIIIGELPEEWLDGIDTGELDRIKLVLERYQNEEFWEDLR